MHVLARSSSCGALVIIPLHLTTPCDARPPHTAHTHENKNKTEAVVVTTRDAHDRVQIFVTNEYRCAFPPPFVSTLK